MNKVNSILVAGAGTAGLVTALILKTKYPQLNIDIVKSDKIGIIGVGEGSTEHWSDFLAFIGEKKEDLIKHCGATFKFGINFKDWGTPDYLNTVSFEMQQIKYTGDFIYYHKLISDGNSPADKHIKNSMYPTKLLKSIVTAQFHFDTHKLNTWLQEKCIERNITITDDEIVDVKLKEDGSIKEVLSKDNTYNADFYIDCTGFKKLLINKLGAKWESYDKYLKMNSAIVFPTGDEDNYNMWTLAKAMKYGWRFKIPVQGRHGNGYIFDGSYITPEQAKEEVEKELGYEIDVKKHIKFDPGALKDTWIKNCVAVGLSANFIEPLEASSIGSSIQSAYVLSQNILNYDEHTIKWYNKSITSINNNIRDFVALHYITPRKDSKFWQDIKEMDITDSLAEKLDLWKTRLPAVDDLINDSGYILFQPQHFVVLLEGLDMIDRDIIKEKYLKLDEKLHSKLDLFESQRNEEIASWDLITHKQAIKEIYNA